MTEIDNIQPRSLVDVRGFGFSHVTKATGGARLSHRNRSDCSRRIGAGRNTLKPVDPEAHRVFAENIKDIAPQDR